MASEIQAQLLAGGAVRKWNVVVCDIVEEMKFVLLQHKSRGNGMNRSITPTLIKESAILVERLEVVDVCLGAQPLKAADLKVGPLKIVS
jgi:hypothetical protein